MHDLHHTDMLRRLRDARRQRTRIGVRHYLARRVEMLRRLDVEDGSRVLDDLTRRYRCEIAALRSGYWTGDANRAEGLRQAILAERAVAIAARREMRRAA